MTAPHVAGIEEPVLWIALRRSSHERRACRDYTVLTQAGGVLLTARAFNWSRDIRLVDDAGDDCAVIRRSRLFPLTGRAAVRALPSMQSLGTVTRSGRFIDAAGTVRGRFRDARSGRERTREGVIVAVGDALLNAGGDSVVSSPSSFVLDVAGQRAGTLTLAKLPFASEPAPAAASRAAALARRILPRRTRDAWRALTAPRGWRFERDAIADGGGLLPVAAALFAVELSRW